MTELKLPKLPDRKAVKIAFTASADLNRDLQEYADAYAASYGAKETVAELIPYMLSAFIASDGGFRRSKTGKS
jgi:hypothetical protein